MATAEDLGSELVSNLVFSLKATASGNHVATQADAGHIQNNDPKLSPIVEGILFSRKLILSYQVVLLALLALFAVRHWLNWSWTRNRQRLRTTSLYAANGNLSRTERLKSAVSDPHNGDVGLSGASSASSTVIGTPPSLRSPSTYQDGERLPLLAFKEPPATLWRFEHKIRAFLMYQPPSMPVLNKILPSNGTTIAVMAFLGLQVFYVFFRMPLSVPLLFVFADRTSLLFVANLPLLYFFAAKNQPIKLLTGYSYESLNIIHRRLGEVMCLLALLHSFGMVGVWYTVLRPAGFSLARFLLIKMIFIGVSAFVVYELIYFTSLGSFRRQWYELFLVLHVVLQVAALVLVWFHHHNSRPYVGAALAIFLVDRLIYRMVLKIQSRQASLHVPKDGGTAILRAELPLAEKRQSWKSLFGGGVFYGWKATEHIFLTVPALSRKHIIQAHPFTIASRAPLDSDTNAKLKLIIRAQDGFSADLVRYAQGHASAIVRMDGPYGSQNALQLLQQSDLSIVVAGGSGIAVALPLVWAVQQYQQVHDLEAKSKNELSKIVLIWVIRQESHTAWLDAREIQDLKDAGIEVFIPPPTETCGHPDLAGKIASLVSDHAVSSYEKVRTGVVCSGPDGMNRAVRNECSLLLAQGYDIDVEVEKFGW
ncbi:MAG: hypothetical protein Q9174_004789 [Haloplaca sp. 1 TL-2023]